MNFPSYIRVGLLPFCCETDDFDIGNKKKLIISVSQYKNELKQFDFVKKNETLKF